MQIKCLKLIHGIKFQNLTKKKKEMEKGRKKAI